MITIKSPREIEMMAAAGRIVAETLALVGRNIRPDLTTEELDQLAENFIRSHPGAQPSFKGLYDFPPRCARRSTTKSCTEFPRTSASCTTATS